MIISGCWYTKSQPAIMCPIIKQHTNNNKDALLKNMGPKADLASTSNFIENIWGGG